MPTITLVTDVTAPRERCFDLARCVDCHVDSMGRFGERAVAGVTSGLLALGDEVTWEARHFGIRQRLTSRITALDWPRFFADEMVSGTFKSFRHEHQFDQVGPALTRVTDVFGFESPLGVIGRAVNAIVVTAYMRRLLRAHARHLKSVLESGRWRDYLSDGAG